MTRNIQRLRPLTVAVALLCVFVFGSLGTAQQNPKRLVLKDGSFQTVTKWEIQGERVRYFSAERYTWEELPKDLIDWPATDKYNQEREALRTEAVKEAAHIEDAEPLENPMVAPGLRLPDGGGIFLLDTYQSQPQLVELTQDGGELNKHTGSNILRAAINPLARSSKQTIELEGEHARTQAHVQEPEIWINVDVAGTSLQMSDESKPAKDSKGQDKDKRKDSAKEAKEKDRAKAMADSKDNKGPSPDDETLQRYRIVRLEHKKGMRVVGQLNVAIYGKVSQKQNLVKTITTHAGGNWVKLAPAEPLAPGEYAVVEVLDAAKNEINLYVWDFGVDPKAPANPSVWTARKPDLGPDGKEKQPELGKRPPRL